MSARSPRPALERLIDRTAVDAYLRAAEAAAPGLRLSLEPPGAADPARPGARRPVLDAGGTPVATLVADGDAPDGLLGVVTAGLGLGLREAEGRRAVAFEALEAYRELNLLYRVAETIGSELDTAVIGPALLHEAERVLRTDAAAVLPAGGAGGAGGAGESVLPAAQLGPARVVDDLLEVGQTLVAQVARDGSAETAIDPGGGFTSLLAAPLTTAGRVLGVLLLGRRSGRPSFTAGELKLVVALAQHGAIAYERARLHALSGDRERLEHEMALGRRIQLGLLPQALPQPGGWEFAAAYEPARQVGGDFYDVFPLRGRRASIGFVMADVTGKGIPAALLMAFARALFRAAADHSRGPAEAIERANRVLVRERPTSLFITVFLGMLRLRTGELTFASGGHEPPLLFPGDGSRARRLAARGTLLGAYERLGLEERTSRVAPGDLVLAYTDGVTDARRPGGDRFGDDRLVRAVRQSAGGSAADVARAVLEAARRFQGAAPAADDLTLLAIRRAPGPRAERTTACAGSRGRPARSRGPASEP